MIELHPVENSVRERSAADTARLLITRGVAHLEQAKAELSQVGASRRAPLADALADFDALDATMVGLRPCREIRELLEQLLRRPASGRRGLGTALRHVTRARELALDLLTNPAIARSAE